MLAEDTDVDTESYRCLKHQIVLKVQGRSNKGSQMAALQDFQQVAVVSVSVILVTLQDGMLHFCIAAVSQSLQRFALLQFPNSLHTQLC